MALSKRTIRSRLLSLMGMETVVLTTASGSSSTVKSAQFAGWGADTFRSMWAVDEEGSGSNDGTYRPIASFDGTGPDATFTVAPAFPGSVGTGKTLKVLPFPPTLVTQAVDRAIRLCYPLLFAPDLDGSLTVPDPVTVAYTMPAGLTPEMIRSVQLEGDLEYAGIPYYPLKKDCWSFSPDGTTLWLGRDGNGPYLRTGAIIYLFAQKYLTALDLDTTWGVLATDTTAKVELTEGTNAWELFLLFLQSAFYSVLATWPPTTDRQGYMTLADSFMKQAMARSHALKMAPLEAFPW